MCYHCSSHCHWGALPLPFPVPPAAVPQMHPQGLARPPALVRWPRTGWSRNSPWREGAVIEKGGLGRAGSLIFFSRCATTPNFKQDQQWAYCLEPQKVQGATQSLEWTRALSFPLVSLLGFWVHLAPSVPPEGEVLGGGSPILQVGKLRPGNLVIKQAGLGIGHGSRLSDSGSPFFLPLCPSLRPLQGIQPLPGGRDLCEHAKRPTLRLSRTLHREALPET